MTQFDLFAIIAVLLTIGRYGIYFNTIYQGKTKPHAFSWLIWGTVTSIGTFAQFHLNAGPSAWALAFVAASCLVIAALSFFIGERNYTRSDWVALIAALIAIPIWKLTQNPLSAILVITAIDLTSYWPTVRKSFHKPQTEPPISFFLAGARYFFILLAIPEPNWQNMLYPFILMCVDCGFALYNIIRRAQLGYPLHEYAKGKS